jgi:hypothetical protein
MASLALKSNVKRCFPHCMNPKRSHFDRFASNRVLAAAGFFACMRKALIAKLPRAM